MLVGCPTDGSRCVVTSTEARATRSGLRPSLLAPLVRSSRGTVLGRLPSGYFVALGPKIIGQVEIVSIKEPSEKVGEDDFPPDGAEVTAVVLGHTPGRQFRLSTRPSRLGAVSE
jgi:hypothetical protein